MPIRLLSHTPNPCRRAARLAVRTAALGLACVTLLTSPQAAGANEAAKRWQGPYLGLTLGLSNSGAGINRGGGAATFEIEQDTAHLGIVGGTNFSLSGLSGVEGLMGGVEADLTSHAGRLRRNDAVLGLVEHEGGVTSTVRFRLGYAFQRLFLYGSAGLAVSTMRVRQAGGNDQTLALGLAAGAGADVAISEKWAARLEAQAIGLGGGKVRLGGANRDIDALGAGTIRLGIVRKF